MNIDLLNCCQECKENTKSLDNPIQDNGNLGGNDDDNILDIMPKVQDVEVILVDLEVPKDFSILQSPDIWVANTGAFNYPWEPWEFRVML